MYGNSSYIDQLGEDCEDYDEDWAPPAMDDEEYWDTDYDEDYQDQISDLYDSSGSNNYFRQSKMNQWRPKWKAKNTNGEKYCQAPYVDVIAGVEEGRENRCAMTRKTI